MDARKVIESGCYGPEALKVAWQAFDDAWADIAGNFGSGREEVEAARTVLAEAILAVATNRQPGRAIAQDSGASHHGVELS